MEWKKECVARGRGREEVMKINKEKMCTYVVMERLQFCCVLFIAFFSASFFGLRTCLCGLMFHLLSISVRGKNGKINKLNKTNFKLYARLIGPSLPSQVPALYMHIHSRCMGTDVGVVRLVRDLRVL